MQVLPVVASHNTVRIQFEVESAEYMHLTVPDASFPPLSPLPLPQVLPVVASHNTVRIQFEVERAEYMHLTVPDASFPRYHFEALADARRAEAYNGAIERAIARAKVEDCGS